MPYKPADYNSVSPYLIVRGATPAGSLSYYDGIPVPSLFHLALGPSVVDPGHWISPPVD